MDNKSALADKFNIKDLYNHIQAETSSNIHIADISDRLFWEESEFYTGFVYDENRANSFWPLLLSNYLQFYLILNFSEFFGLKEKILPKLENIFENEL